MDEFSPYAIFVGASFVIGFVARAAVGGYRKTRTKNKQVEEPLVLTEKDMVETTKISDIPDIKYPTLVNPYIPRTEPKDVVKETSEWIRNYPFNKTQKSKELLNEVLKDHEKSKEELLNELAKDHEKSNVFLTPTPISMKPPVKIRILPPANNHEVFGQLHRLDPHTYKSVEKYYYNAIVRGEEEKGPQVLSVSPTVHRKIVEAFTNPEDDDVSNLVTGCDLHIYTVDQFEVRVDKGDRCPVGEPTQVEGWLKKTANLSQLINSTVSPLSHPLQYQKRPKDFDNELKSQSRAQSDQGPFADNFLKETAQIEEVVSKGLKKKSKVVSFNLESVLYEDLRSEAKKKGVSASNLLAEILKQHLWEEETEEDEAGDRQFHFSTGEMVRLTSMSNVYPHITDNFVWTCSRIQREKTDSRFWEHNPPKAGDTGRIVGFVMKRDSQGRTTSLDKGVAVVEIKNNRSVRLDYLAVGFDCLESIDNGALKNAVTDLREGDWVHWQTQKGSRSVRPSVVFKVRKQKRGNEVQLGYVQDKKVVRFWTPASKCTKCKEVPRGFTGLLAHQLPEKQLAEKLRVL